MSRYPRRRSLNPYSLNLQRSEVVYLCRATATLMLVRRSRPRVEAFPITENRAIRELRRVTLAESRRIKADFELLNDNAFGIMDGTRQSDDSVVPPVVWLIENGMRVIVECRNGQELVDNLLPVFVVRYQMHGVLGSRLQVHRSIDGFAEFWLQEASFSSRRSWRTAE